MTAILVERERSAASKPSYCTAAGCMVARHQIWQFHAWAYSPRVTNWAHWGDPDADCAGIECVQEGNTKIDMGILN